MKDVFAIDDSGRAERLKAHYCRDEALELQTLLAENPDLLAGEQMNPEDPRRWLLIGQEIPVPDPESGGSRWAIDHVFVDQDAIPTLVECKRFRDTRSRREVVAQMIEYAANGHHYWNADDLSALAAKTAAKSNRLVADEIAALSPSESSNPQEFFAQVVRNLREGRVRLIFFLEEAPYQLRSIVDFLNRQMERSEVLLVEARQFLVGGRCIVIPSLFGYTEEARRAKRSQSERRQWTHESFFADLGARLGNPATAVVDRLYRTLREQGLEISWGTGKAHGSMSAIARDINPRSILSVYTDGRLVWNVGWLNEDDRARRFRDELVRRLSEQLNFDFPDCVESRYIGMKPDLWIERYAEIEELLTSTLNDARKLEPTS